MIRAFKSAGPVLFVLLTALLLTGCSHREQETVHTLGDPVTEQHGSILVERGDYTSVTVMDAFVVPEVVTLEPEISGTVSEVPFLSGETVRKGDVVLRLDTRDEEAELAKIRADMEYQETLDAYEDQLYVLDHTILERRKVQNYQQGGSWQNSELLSLDIQELELTREEKLKEREKRREKWQERIRELEDTIEKSVLTAPVSGRVYYPGTADDGLGSVAREGENVTLHTPVCFILDESSLHIEMEEKLSSELAGRNCYALAGGEKISVEYELPSVEEAAKERLLSRLPKTVFRLKEGSEGLKAGQYTPIVFEMEVYQDVLLVPASAVLRDPDLREDYVFVLNADGSYERRNVEAESDGVKAVIRSGLSGGEELYVPE